MSHQDIATALGLLVVLGLLITGILFVLFGEVTVRRLRKNPETRDLLGLELASGWNIQNVAHAIALPRSLQRRLSNGPLSFMYADPDIIYRYTTRLDRLLGRTFFWSLMATGFLIAIWAIVVS